MANKKTIEQQIENAGVEPAEQISEDISPEIDRMEEEEEAEKTSPPPPKPKAKKKENPVENGVFRAPFLMSRAEAMAQVERVRAKRK